MKFANIAALIGRAILSALVSEAADRMTRPKANPKPEPESEHG